MLNCYYSFPATKGRGCDSTALPASHSGVHIKDAVPTNSSVDITDRSGCAKETEAMCVRAPTESAEVGFRAPAADCTISLGRKPRGLVTVDASVAAVCWGHPLRHIDSVVPAHPLDEPACLDECESIGVVRAASLSSYTSCRQ